VLRRGRFLLALAVCAMAAIGAVQSQGACCTFDDCLPAADEPECNSLNGVFLDGEDCSTDPCGPGACCQGTNCQQAEAFPCITAGREYAGAGTTCLVAEQLGRDSVGIELNPEYAQMARDRIDQAAARRMIGEREPRGEDARQVEMFA